MATCAFSGGNNVGISASTTSASGALPNGANARAVRVYNATNAVAFIRFGATAPTAVATDTFVAPGATEVFSLPPDSAFAAVILSASTGSVYFQAGDGA